MYNIFLQKFSAFRRDNVNTHIQTDKNKTHNKTIANSTLDTVEYGNGNINDNYSNYQITEENETNYYGLNCKKPSNGQHLR